MCYFLDDTIKIDFDLDNILIDEKSCENFLAYSISYKNLMDAKLLCLNRDKIDEFIRTYDGTRYFVLFKSAKYYFIYNRIIQLISVKSDITYTIFHNYAKIKIVWKDLDIEKALVSNKIFSGKKFIDISLLPCIMLIKLSHYI